MNTNEYKSTDAPDRYKADKKSKSWRERACYYIDGHLDDTDMIDDVSVHVRWLWYRNNMQCKEMGLDENVYIRYMYFIMTHNYTDMYNDTILRDESKCIRDILHMDTTQILDLQKVYEYLLKTHNRSYVLGDVKNKFIRYIYFLDRILDDRYKIDSCNDIKFLQDPDKNTICEFHVGQTVMHIRIDRCKEVVIRDITSKYIVALGKRFDINKPHNILSNSDVGYLRLIS
jgi:hypothetical protein